MLILSCRQLCVYRFMSKEPIELNETENSLEFLELDAKGLYCPEPVMLLHNKIRDMPTGQVLRLIATDSSTARDIPKFCMYLGHDLISQDYDGEFYTYCIRKKPE